MSPDKLYATTVEDQLAVINELITTYQPIREAAEKDHEMARRALLFAIDVLGFYERRMEAEQKLAVILASLKDKAVQGKYVLPSADQVSTTPSLLVERLETGQTGGL